MICDCDGVVAWRRRAPEMKERREKGRRGGGFSHGATIGRERRGRTERKKKRHLLEISLTARHDRAPPSTTVVLFYFFFFTFPPFFVLIFILAFDLLVQMVVFHHKLSRMICIRENVSNTF